MQAPQNLHTLEFIKTLHKLVKLEFTRTRTFFLIKPQRHVSIAKYQWRRIEASPDHSHLDHQKRFLQALVSHLGAAHSINSQYEAKYIRSL